MINRLKILLMRFRAARWLASVKNGTVHLLRHGYHPRDFWEQWAERFTHQPYQRKLHESNFWLLARLQESRPTELLEVGCGFGRNLRFFREQLGFPCRLFGLDLSFTLLQQARRELAFDLPLVCGDITRLPFRDGSFETVVTHGVLMHVPPEHVREAIRELARVTSKTLWCLEEQVRVGVRPGESLSINEYTFAHDYPTLFKELGIPVARADYQGRAIAMILMRVDLK